MIGARTRGALRAVIGLGLVAALGLAIANHLSWRAERDQQSSVAEAVEFDTSEIAVRSLSRAVEVEGTLVYDTSVTIAAPVAGTVLDVVAAGTEPGSGDVLARVDDTAVVWLDGGLPAWRALGVGDEGDDVAQLEAALVALGYDPDGEVTVDDEFTDATGRMVERWQEATGVAETGRVEFGTVVFSAGQTRVASTAKAVGDRVESGPLLTVGTTERVVEFEAAPADAATLAVGDSVRVTLPDAAVSTAVVRSIDDSAEAWSVVAAVDDPNLPPRDTLGVDVDWSVALADEVPTVPSSALLRLDDGSYVVDVVAADGSLDRRPVSIGATTDTRVEIVAGLAIGDEVVVL